MWTCECELRSSRLRCVWLCRFLDHGWFLKPTIFLMAKQIMVLVFVPVGFYPLSTSWKQSFRWLKWPLERVTTYVQWVFWFSAMNDTSTSNRLPQVDFVFQSCLASARVHSWTLNLLSGPFSRRNGYECGIVRRKLWWSALLGPRKLQPSISSTEDVCHQFHLSDERIHFCMEWPPIKNFCEWKLI